MRKIYISVLMAFFVTTIFAQEENQDVLKNKKGVEILPTAGMWGFGISATPFFSYLGNFFSSDINSVPTFGTVSSPMTFSGRYLLTDHKAFDINFMVGLNMETDKDGGVNSSNKDVTKTSALQLGISAGLTNIVGNGRLRGNYGGFLSFTKIPYHQVFNNYPYDPNIYTMLIGKEVFESGSSSNFSYTRKGGNTYMGGIGGKVGAEFFFAPKFSLSGNLYLILQGGVQTEREYIPQNGDKIVEDAGGSAFEMTTTGSGTINLNFYF